LSSETEYLVNREAKKLTKSIPQNPQSDSCREADILCEISKVRREPTSTLALPKSHSLSWWVCGFTCHTYKYIFSILNILSQPDKKVMTISHLTTLKQPISKNETTKPHPAEK
jgi:hypothetical protein